MPEYERASPLALIAPPRSVSPVAAKISEPYRQILRTWGVHDTGERHFIHKDCAVSLAAAQAASMANAGQLASLPNGTTATVRHLQGQAGVPTRRATRRATLGRRPSTAGTVGYVVRWR